MLSKTLRSFRRNQKAWMAGLIILCMVTFVMCQGIGAGSNLLDSLGVRFGARRYEPRGGPGQRFWAFRRASLYSLALFNG